jgi:single-strand DNA-binding protein
LASNRQFKNKQTGAMVQEVCFIDIDVWGPQAESCRQYLSKGRAVLIEGRLKFDTWQESDGNKRSKHSIVADRVTFVGAGAQDETDASAGGADITPAVAESTGSSYDAGAAEPAKASRARKPAKPADDVATGSGEVNLKDQKPFEDDLPF